jgi:hypothetical protein
VLRLNPAQRDEIAAELMDHLQERLAELTARGMQRDQAVKIALEEFGDAAGLAAQFLLVVSQQRRRRIMKWTAASVMAAIVVLYGAYAFWPAEPARGPAPTLVAQQPPAPADAKKKKKSAAGSASTAASKQAANRDLEQRLAERIAATFPNETLQGFLDAVGEQAKVDFYLDKQALEDAGVRTDTPISVNLKNIRIDELLDLVLDQLDLVSIPRESYVFVTTIDMLEEQLETRVYNCRDLVELSLIGRIPSADGSGGFHEGDAGYSGYGGGYGTSAPGGMGSAAMGAPGMAGMGPGMPGMGMAGMSGAMGMASGGMGMADMGAMGAGMAMSAHSSQPAYLSTLIEVITKTVLPYSWDQETGGPGSIAAYHGGLLVVNHHAQAHQKIDRLLGMLRDAAKDRPGAVVRER